jgi:para-nitrobenzyl esterase
MTRTRLLLVLVLVASLLATLACGSTPSADPASTRSIAQGSVTGAASDDGATHIWRGIPFAKPPMGELRWRAPRAPDAFSEPLDALESGSACAQLGGDSILGSEDCLYLDIYAPRWDAAAVPTDDARLPVMFWIHGGGNSMGAGNQIPPTRLAAEHDVIVVTINYRLGIFGWFSHPALRASADGPEDASGNYGTLDMIRSLEWVRDNISAFGGNPDRVTIFGESAGGINVYSLLLSPRAEGLFHAAIAQSGSAFSLTRSQAENYVDDPDAQGLDGSSAELVVALLGGMERAADREAAKPVAASMGRDEIEAMLRGLSTEELLAPFADAAADSNMPIYLSPTIIRDGHVIVDMEPLVALSTPGAYNAVPFIAGTNREESKLFAAFSSPHVSYTFGLPTSFLDERLYDIEGEYGGLTWRVMGVDRPVSAMRSAQGPSVWAYRFDWDEEPVIMGMDLSKLLGAAHALELPFVFGLTDLGFGNRFLYADPPSAEVLSSQMRSYWTQMAHTRAPGRGRHSDLPEWSAWNPVPDAPKYLIFDSPNDGGLEFGSDQIDQEFILTKVAGDSRLQTTEERCRVLRNMVQWSDVLTPTEYAAIDDGACQAYPLASRVEFASLPK